LSGLGYEVRTVVVAEQEPADGSWAELLVDQEIELVSPVGFSTFLARLNPRPDQ
jgi:hypothetical protein